MAERLIDIRIPDDEEYKNYLEFIKGIKKADIPNIIHTQLGSTYADHIAGYSSIIPATLHVVNYNGRALYIIVFRYGFIYLGNEYGNAWKVIWFTNISNVNKTDNSIIFTIPKIERKWRSNIPEKIFEFTPLPGNQSNFNIFISNLTKALESYAIIDISKKSLVNNMNSTKSNNSNYSRLTFTKNPSFNSTKFNLTKLIPSGGRRKTKRSKRTKRTRRNKKCKRRTRRS